jgi:predicted amidohydrolase YtcJ
MMTVPENQLLKTQIEMTVVGGKIAYQKNNFLN